LRTARVSRIGSWLLFHISLIPFFLYLGETMCFERVSLSDNYDDRSIGWSLRLLRVALLVVLVFFCMAGQSKCSPPKLGSVIAEHGEGCQNSAIHNVKCAPGLSCLGYDTPAVDSGYGGAFCEIPCNSALECPDGYQCSYVADGPWQLCTRSTTDDGSLCPHAVELDPSIPGVATDPSTGTTVLYDDTTAYGGDSEPNQCNIDENYGGPEAVYQFEAPYTGVYEFWLDPSVTKFDAVLYLSTACPVTPSSCTAFDDDTFLVLGNDKVRMLLHQDEKILVYVDGKEPTWAEEALISDYAKGGSFKLVISLD
jgi:hypothetical protein